jgi:hypothetical protein
MKYNNFTKLAGYGIEFTGKIISRTDVEWLGHYMSCSGKDKILPDKHIKLIKDKSLEDFIVYCDNYNDSEYRGLGYNKNELYFDYQYEDCPRNTILEFYQTVGKFKLIKDGDKVNFLDKYIFYPWCGRFSHDSENCNCDTKKHFEDLRLLYHKFHNKFFKNFIAHFLSYDKKVIKIHGIRITVSYLSIEILISDEIFVNLGKPFYTRGIISVQGE